MPARLVGTVWNGVGLPETARSEAEARADEVRGAAELQMVVPHAGKMLRAHAALGVDASAERAAREIRRRAEAAARGRARASAIVDRLAAPIHDPAPRRPFLDAGRDSRLTR